MDELITITWNRRDGLRRMSVQLSVETMLEASTNFHALAEVLKDLVNCGQDEDVTWN